MLNQIKGIKQSLELSTIREINNYLYDFRNELSNYKYDNDINEIKEYNIYKVCSKISNTDIFDMKYRDIEKYIDSLISIVEFIEV